MSRAVDFKNDPVGRLIFRLSLPAFFAIVMNLLYGFVDGIFIGRGIDSRALGGVSIVFPLMIILMSFASLIGEGSASIIARGIAAGRDQLVSATIRTAQGVIFWLTLAFIFVSMMFIRPLMTALGATPDILVYSADYYRALLPGFPFMALSLVYFHQLNAQGEIRVAMRAMIISTLLNIALDYLAIYILHLGISGAGAATSISQAVWYLYMHIHSVRNPGIRTIRHPIIFRIDFNILKEIAAIGFSSFVRQAGISVAMIIINSLAGRYGNSIHIISFGAAQRIFRLFVAPIAALATAMKPVVGHNYGFGEFQRVKDSMKLSFKLSLAAGSVLLILLAALKVPLGRAFGIEPGQMDVFVKVIMLTSFLLPLYGIQHIIVSYFISLGKAKEALILNLLKQVILLIPLVFILPLFFGVYGLFIALPAADLLSISAAVVLYRRTQISG